MKLSRQTAFLHVHIAREGYDRAKGCEKDTLFMGPDTSSAKSPAQTCRVFFGVCYVNAFDRYMERDG